LSDIQKPKDNSREFDNWYITAMKALSDNDTPWQIYAKKKEQFENWFKKSQIDQAMRDELIKEANKEYHQKAKELMELD
jgi:beta-lactamase class D